MQFRKYLYILLPLIFAGSHGCKKKPKPVEDIGSVDEIQECLLSQMLFSEELWNCETPFTKGACLSGNILVIGPNGEGICKPILQCPRNQQQVLDIDQGSLCNCKGGYLRVGDGCYEIFSAGSCNAGELVIDKSQKIIINEPFYWQCPLDFTMKDKDACIPYQKGRETYKALQQPNLLPNLKKNVKELFRQIHISQNNYCCPPNTMSLLTAHNIFRSHVFPSEGVCATNPCPGNTWPWVIDNILRCVPAGDSVRGQCGKGLIFDDDQNLLICADVVDVNFALINGGGKFCKKGTISSRGRCKTLFRG